VKKFRVSKIQKRKKSLLILIQIKALSLFIKYYIVSTERTEKEQSAHRQTREISSRRGIHNLFRVIKMYSSSVLRTFTSNKQSSLSFQSVRSKISSSNSSSSSSLRRRRKTNNNHDINQRRQRGQRRVLVLFSAQQDNNSTSAPENSSVLARDDEDDGDVFRVVGNERVLERSSSVAGDKSAQSQIEERERKMEIIDPLSPEFTNSIKDKYQQKQQMINSKGNLSSFNKSASSASASANSSSSTVSKEPSQIEKKLNDDNFSMKKKMLGASALGLLGLTGVAGANLLSGLEGFAPLAAFEQLIGLGATLRYAPGAIKPFLSERGRQLKKIEAADALGTIVKDSTDIYGLFPFIKTTGSQDLDEKLRKAMTNESTSLSDWESRDAKVLRAIVSDFVTEREFKLLSQEERLKALQTLPEKLENAQDLVFKAKKESAEFEAQVKASKLEARLSLDKKTQELQDLQRSSEQTIQALSNQIAILSGQNFNNKEKLSTLEKDLITAKTELKKFENLEREQTNDFLNAEAQNAKVINQIREHAKLAENVLLEQMEFVRNETRNEIQMYKSEAELAEKKLREDLKAEFELKKETLKVEMAIPLDKANAKIANLEQKYQDISVKLIQRKQELAIANDQLKILQNELYSREQSHDEEVQCLHEELSKARSNISLLEASIIEATESESMRVADIERQLANEKFAHESAKLAAFELENALKNAELSFDVEKKQMLVNLAQQLELEKADYERDAVMAVKEIEMIEIEVEESKKMKESLESELMKMREFYEETNLRANERNRTLQSELAQMKKSVQASTEKALEMERVQMEALKQIQIERESFATEKDLMQAEASKQIQIERESFATEKDLMRAEFNTQSEEYVKEISMLSKTIKSEQNNAKTFRDALMHAETRVEGFMKKITTLRTELDKKTELSEEYKARLDKAQNYAMKIKMEAELKVNEQLKNVQRLERVIDEKDFALMDLKQELIDATAAAKHLIEPSEIEEMERTMEQLSAKKLEKEQEAANARADLIAQQMINASLVERNRTFESKNQKLRQDVLTRQSYEGSIEQKNFRETERKLKETEQNYEQMKQTFNGAAKENVELKRELDMTRMDIASLKQNAFNVEDAQKEEVRSLKALAFELEQKLAEADENALRTNEALKKVRLDAQNEAAKIVSETKARATEAEKMLMNERTQNSITFSELELKFDSVQGELSKQKKQTEILFTELDLSKERLSSNESEYEEREAKVVMRIKDEFHDKMLSLEEKVICAENAMRDAEMRAGALQQYLLLENEIDRERVQEEEEEEEVEQTVKRVKEETNKKTPLSKLKKHELISLCVAMSIEEDGTIPVLRARLRNAGY